MHQYYYKIIKSTIFEFFIIKLIYMILSLFVLPWTVIDIADNAAMQCTHHKVCANFVGFYINEIFIEISINQLHFILNKKLYTLLKISFKLKRHWLIDVIMHISLIRNPMILPQSCNITVTCQCITSTSLKGTYNNCSLRQSTLKLMTQP